MHTDHLADFVCTQASVIYRNAQGCLNHPFLVPGGLFHDELWDWDSFWIVEGLIPLMAKQDSASQQKFLSHATGSWINFFEHQAPDGSLPIMLKSDNGDFFDCTRPDGVEKNQAKPVFAQFALSLSRFTGDFQWMEPYYECLKSFHRRWRTKYGTDCGLLVWGSDAAIGVDNDPTTYGRPDFSSGNLLLNCLFHQELQAMIEIAKALERTEDAVQFGEEARQRGTSIRRECWDEVDGFFYTVDVQCNDHRQQHFPQNKRGMDMAWKTVPQKVKMFTGFLPLWAGIATETQARILVEDHLRNPEEFAARHGIRSLARNERMYDPDTDSANPSNWLGPVWIVAHYMIYKGLLRYGFREEAADLANKTKALLSSDLMATGELHECYHPDTGKPNFNAGFLSWNILAAGMI